MATVRAKFGTKIRELRKKASLSQEKLAEQTKIDYTYLNMIEAGKRNPSLKIIAKLARVLKTSISDLFKFK